MKHFLACLIGISILLGPSLLLAEDDVQYWSRFGLKVIDTKYADYVTYGELKLFEDMSDFSSWQTSQKLILEPFQYLGFGLNYTYLESEVKNTTTGQEEFKNQHRLELEINPQYENKKWVHVKIKNRNRFEFRWIEDRGSDNGRFRHLWEFEFPLKFKKISLLKSIYINNEFFVALNRQELNENRVTPIGIKLRITDKNSISFFYMIQSQKGAHDWTSNQIIGSYLSLSV